MRGRHRLPYPAFEAHLPRPAGSLQTGGAERSGGARHPASLGALAKPRGGGAVYEDAVICSRAPAAA